MKWNSVKDKSPPEPYGIINRKTYLIYNAEGTNIATYIGYNGLWENLEGERICPFYWLDVEIKE